MSKKNAYNPEFESIKELLLDMAQELSADRLLNMIVSRLAERPHIALARIWLIGEGDMCPTCPLREKCPDQTRCLHLVASVFCPLKEGGKKRATHKGEYKRFPLGVPMVGSIASTGEARVVEDIEQEAGWIIQRGWALREMLLGYGGQPLLYKGEVLGVIDLFTRIRVLPEGKVWLRMIANHAATAIANARAFEEIENLKRQLELEKAYLQEELSEVQAFGDIVGQSHGLRTIQQQVELVAPTDASVLILGESGTGKELIAREIHKRSTRKDRPTVKVNCASIPRELYESEFFGHVKGAFTGAVKDRAGRFETANLSTLFLDEVGEIPMELQSKLLRVLQEGQYERVGEERTRKVDVRIIAATNRELKKEVEAGRFRQDLYYRLNVFPIEVPPLRQRKEDIPLLAAHFLERAAKKMNKPTPRLNQANLLDLQGYHWPGNARELQNAIERAVISMQSGLLRFDLPQPALTAKSARPSPTSPGQAGAIEIIPEKEFRRREGENILAALEQCGWKIYGPQGAAALLGIKPTTLASRMKKMGIRKSPRS